MAPRMPADRSPLLERLEGRRLLTGNLSTLPGPFIDGRPGPTIDLAPLPGGYGAENGPSLPSPIAPVDGPAYNSDFLTDAQLLNSDAMTIAEVRAFLTSYNSYFRNPVPDVDGTTFDLAEAVVLAGQTHGINPQVLLTTIQKEHVGVTRTGRPTEAQMAFIMGSGQASTATLQVFDAAKRFSEYYDELTADGATRSGWRVGVAKRTQDGVWVTPATKATAGQFTYTPYAGAQWGGDDARWGGVWLFYHYWNSFGFNDRQGPQLLASGFDVDSSRQQLRFAFDEDVSNSLSPHDLQIRNLTTGMTVHASDMAMSYDHATDTATFRFPDYANGVLPDGNYRVTLAGSGVSDRYGNTMSSLTHVDFYTLAGDANRDRTVSLADFLVLRGNFGQSGKFFSDGDFNYDEQVSLADFLILRGNFGQGMPALSPSPIPTTPSLFDGKGDDGDRRASILA